jgi:hypothetical protein
MSDKLPSLSVASGLTKLKANDKLGSLSDL